MEQLTERERNTSNQTPQQVTVVDGRHVDRLPTAGGGSPGYSLGSISTLSASFRSLLAGGGAHSVSNSTAMPSIFNREESNEEVEEVFESDGEEDYPDDNSAGSNASDFELLASSTDDV